MRYMNKADLSDNASLRILRRPAEVRHELAQLKERHDAYLNRNFAVCGTGKSEHRDDFCLSEGVAVEMEIQKKHTELDVAVNAAEALLQRLEVMRGIISYRNALVLRLRYLKNLAWKDVCITLRREGFPSTERTVRNWHNAALKQLDTLQKTQ